jgi:alanyl-tRNA synthetase
MNADRLRECYQRFFEERGHRRIRSAPLLPENDPTVLFTTAGMHPLVPFLLGEPHPLGQRLVGVQECLRTDDIDEVGDTSHLTFFEMLGNWSLGDYFKEEALSWSYEFLAQELGIAPSRLAVTVFAGDEDAPRDEESAAIWRRLGIPDGRIFFLPKQENWWGPAGATGPCGPDSEIFYDTGRPDHPGCRPGCSCGKWFEIWNVVFMEYHKTADGRCEKLAQRNVDTGMGIERTVAALQGCDDVFEADGFRPIVRHLEQLSGRQYAENPKPFRVIADHLRAATFAIADGVYPSNVEAGYVVRRLIRRAIRYGRDLGIPSDFCAAIASVAVELSRHVYPELEQERFHITNEMEREETKFRGTLERALAEYRKVARRVKAQGDPVISGDAAFDLFETFGFPLSFTVELAGEEGLTVDTTGFETRFRQHQQVSRRGVERTFKGGLADHSVATTRLHTATHLLQAALRQVLGPEVQQKGSNITTERLRFDFAYPSRLSQEQIRQVEDLVNRQIQRNLPVACEVMPREQALQRGALAFFGEKYGDQVKVYTIGDFSTEICGGPHVLQTGELGRFRIMKQEQIGGGLQRIRAVLETKQPMEA